MILNLCYPKTNNGSGGWACYNLFNKFGLSVGFMRGGAHSYPAWGTYIRSYKMNYDNGHKPYSTVILLFLGDSSYGLYLDWRSK